MRQCMDTISTTKHLCTYWKISRTEAELSHITFNFESRQSGYWEAASVMQDDSLKGLSIQHANLWSKLSNDDRISDTSRREGFGRISVVLNKHSIWPMNNSKSFPVLAIVASLCWINNLLIPFTNVRFTFYHILFTIFRREPFKTKFKEPNVLFERFPTLFEYL